MASSAEKIANHLGWDIEEVKEGRYQSTGWNKPVFVVGDDYWCAAPTPAKRIYGDLAPWKKVISSYDRKTVLWTISISEEE